MAACARAMPMASMVSSVSPRSPAVSISVNGTPPIATGRLSTSRVVPGISAVIAASLPTSALNSVLLPAFGGPAITTRTPSRNASALGRDSHCAKASAKAANRRARSAGKPPTSSSSAKSMAASILALMVSRSSRHPATTRENAPPSIACAARRCNSVSADSKSANPTASARSMRPLANARRVNSPASAARKPGTADKARNTAAITARPPWQCSSAQSSPVAVPGPGSHNTNAESSTSPPSRNVISVARRAAGTRPKRANTAEACGPLIRITPTPAGGAPLDSA